jgi:hypothetical protein
MRERDLAPRAGRNAPISNSPSRTPGNQYFRAQNSAFLAILSAVFPQVGGFPEGASATQRTNGEPRGPPETRQREKQFRAIINND